MLRLRFIDVISAHNNNKGLERRHSHKQFCQEAVEHLECQAQLEGEKDKHDERRL